MPTHTTRNFLGFVSANLRPLEGGATAKPTGKVRIHTAPRPAPSRESSPQAGLTPGPRALRPGAHREGTDRTAPAKPRETRLRGGRSCPCTAFRSSRTPQGTWGALSAERPAFRFGSGMDLRVVRDSSALCPPQPPLSNQRKSFNRKDTKPSKHTVGGDANPVWEHPRPLVRPAGTRNTAPGSAHQQGNHDTKCELRRQEQAREKAASDQIRYKGRAQTRVREDPARAGDGGGTGLRSRRHKRPAGTP